MLSARLLFYRHKVEVLLLLLFQEKKRFPYISSVKPTPTSQTFSACMSAALTASDVQ